MSKLPIRRNKILANYSLEDIGKIYEEIANDLTTPELISDYLKITVDEAIALEFASRCLFKHRVGDKQFIQDNEELFISCLGRVVLSGFIPPHKDKRLN